MQKFGILRKSLQNIQANFRRCQVISLMNIFSVGCMGISMGLLGFSMYCQHISYEFPGLRVIPLISLVLYTFSFGSGKK